MHTYTYHIDILFNGFGLVSLRGAGGSGGRGEAPSSPGKDGRGGLGAKPLPQIVRICVYMCIYPYLKRI